MKLNSAALFATLLPLVSALTGDELGCNGGEASYGTAAGSLEDAGLQAAIQQLVIFPEVPISITNNALYRLKIIAPGDLYFNAFLLRAEFSQPELDSVVLNPDFELTPSSSNAAVSSVCLGNVLGLVHTDLEPKKEVEGRFNLNEIGNFDLDLTVIVLDDEGNESVYYSRYNLTSTEELPDIPTITPVLLTTSPMPTNAPNATNATNYTFAPVMTPVDGGAPVAAPTTTTTGSGGSSPVAAPVGSTSSTTGGSSEDDAETGVDETTEAESRSPIVMLSTVVLGGFFMSLGLMFL